MTLWAINRAAHGRRENYAIKIIQIKEGFCVCESGFTMYEFFKMDDRVLKAAEEAEQKAAPYLAKISETQRYNQEKMQAAFMQAGVSESHFVATTGYGYGDRGRDVLDEVYARALGAEDALCRYNFVSGTHTLTVALFGVLRPGDTMLSVTGSGTLDNEQGIISAGSTLTVADRDLAQKRQAINNGAGTLIAGQSLLLDSAIWAR